MKMPNIAVLPSLVTLGNAVCGFAAMAVIARAAPLMIDGELHGATVNAYALAGYLIFLAMVFDALDGRVARFARATSDFGGQLDSLSDAVSFGAAPALLAYRLVADVIPAQNMVRLAMILAAAYTGCTLLRLARFNVENVHDEEAHMAFRGLPSPAAAGALAGLVALLMSLCQDVETMPTVARYLVWCLPAVALVLGLLMVSTVRYTHLVNQLIRGRRPLWHLLIMLLLVLLVVYQKERVLAIFFVAYAVSGPVLLAYRKVAHAFRSRATASSARREDHREV
ncbi:MAG: CDP-diacylglycerol--serine O-phosphatidyltransferase [Planctomycetes bacterium]|nr:CDP-diacylglycerol--serine O-phosphatidyltransferase [Planctomycetota bacterium]